MVGEGRDGGGEKQGEKREEHDKCASCVSGCFEDRDIPCSGGTWQIVPSTGDHKWKWSGINNDLS